MKRQFAIIGLGYFGTTIALELTRLGNDVLVIDIQEKLINDIVEQVTYAVIADAADEKVLRELNIQQYDAAVVAIGEDIEASLLCTLNLKNLGMQQVWVKAINNQHHKLLHKLGATRIIHPELEMGTHVAHSLNYPMVVNYFDLGDRQFVVEISVQPQQVGKTIDQVLRQSNSSALVLAIKRGENLINNSENRLTLNPEDQLILAGPLTELRKLSGS